MQIVIDKESLVNMFAVSLFAVVGNDYQTAKDCVNEILENIGYTELPKGHDYIDRNNAITSICQHYTTCERMKMLSFTPNIIKQEVTDILCAEPTIIEADKEVEE